MFGEHSKLISPGFAGFQRSLRLVEPACVSNTTPKITPADSKRLHNHSTEVAEIFVGGLLRVCHEIPTRHRMEYSLGRSESGFAKLTWKTFESTHTSKTKVDWAIPGGIYGVPGDAWGAWRWCRVFARS